MSFSEFVFPHAAWAGREIVSSFFPLRPPSSQVLIANITIHESIRERDALTASAADLTDIPFLPKAIASDIPSAPPGKSGARPPVFSWRRAWDYSEVD